ncbi:Protein SVP26 [Teratosphaeria destructans]|uniref:Protein SVP26 n=1 Tax=Teratosphaeria destructans TaxID=418781 RepID=A0A9W7W215_9PEZI|nr:Protein SVP26 [Teratosphaeria destructans]
MWILPLLGYVGLILAFVFLTLAIASGLYYLSELVEEHTVAAKKVLTRLIYAIIAAQVLLALVDKLPWTLSALSIASHVVYLQNLRRFPIVKLTDPVFIASCILVLVNHWLWFRHFSAPPPPKDRYGYWEAQDLPTFTEIASFFGLNVWLVPFALFVSLSAGENVLPSMGSEYATGQGSSYISAGQEPASGIPGGLNGGVTGRTRHKRSGTQTGMAKAAVNGVREWAGETGELLGLWKGDRTRPL